MTRIAVLASFNMDLVMRAERRPEAGETLQGEFAMFLGGKGFNQAVAARRLGADVAVVGRVGDDAFGARFLAALDAEGIDRSAVAVDPDAGTGVATIVVEPDGTNSIVQAPRANRALTAADVDRLPGNMHGVDVALLNIETSMPAAIAFARAARDAGARVVLNPAPAGDVPGELLALADVLAPNAVEAQALTGEPATTPDDALAAASRLLARGPSAVVVTLGGQGAVALARGVHVHVPALPVRAVDTVGAGDAFCAALAVRLGEGAGIEDAVRFANAAGALSTTIAGAEPSMPRRHAVEALLAGPAATPR